MIITFIKSGIYEIIRELSLFGKIYFVSFFKEERTTSNNSIENATTKKTKISDSIPQNLDIAVISLTSIR